MRDWRETEGDCWGPIELHHPGMCSRSGDARIVDSGLRINGPWELHLDALRALLRAHYLRTKAPVTECDACAGTGKVSPDDRFEVGCRECETSGRNLTPDELERWEGRKT